MTTISNRFTPRITTGGILAALLALTVAAVCVRLGFWQLDRLEQRRAANAVLERALTLPPLELWGDTLEAVLRAPAAYQNRRAVVRGIYDPEVEVVLRGRAHHGRPGVHLVAALRLRDTSHSLLVNRGWVGSPDAARADPAPFRIPGEQEVLGLLLAAPEPEDGGAASLVDVEGAEVLTLRRLHLPTLQARSDRPLLNLYLQRLPQGTAEPGPAPVDIPALDDGPHLGYAVQWFGFAAVAVAGLAVVAWRSRRRL